MGKNSIGLDVGPMVKRDFNHNRSNNYTLLTSHGWGLHYGPLVHNHLHTYKTWIPFIQIKKTQRWLTLPCKNDQWKCIGCHTIQVCPRWFFIIGFFTSCYYYFVMSHSIGVCISPCSPCKNSKTWAWGCMQV
jgi:hypothetical protein